MDKLIDEEIDDLLSLRELPELGSTSKGVYFSLASIEKEKNVEYIHKSISHIFWQFCIK